MKSIDVICPVYREEDGITEFHERLVAATSELAVAYRLRFVYVADPAPDCTEDRLRSIADAAANVEVLVMSRRFGHQAALLAGIERSDADAVVMLDSDGQHPPELIPKLVSLWQSGAQIVQTLRDDGDEIGFVKRTSSRLFYRLLSRVSSVDLPPGAADYRLLDRVVVRVIREALPERNMFLRGLLHWIGYTTCYVPFKPAARARGASKYNAGVLFNFALVGISSFSKAPLRLCTVTGLVIALLALGVGIIEIVAYTVGNVAVPGWASLMAVTTFFGGVQLLFLGMTGEYVGQIFDEVKARPRYLIARQYGNPAPAKPDEVVT